MVVDGQDYTVAWSGSQGWAQVKWCGRGYLTAHLIIPTRIDERWCALYDPPRRKYVPVTERKVSFRLVSSPMPTLR